MLALSLLLIVMVLVAIPLFDRKRSAVQPPNPYDVLEAERRSAIQSIRELDFDFKTHKLDDDEYKTLRVEAVQHGATILQQLKALPKHSIDDDIESQVTKLREDKNDIEANIKSETIESKVAVAE